MTDRTAKRGIGRRDFLRYAGYSGVALGMGGVLAACRDAGTTPGAEGSVQASLPPMEQEPGGLQVFDWSGYGNGDYYPQGREEDSSGSVRAGDRRHPRVHAVRERRHRVHEGRRRCSLRRRAPLRLSLQDWVDLGILQPWDTSASPTTPR